MPGSRPGIGEHAKLGLDQLALGGDEQHAHLHAIVVGIEDLEVQLHRLHVEGHVLLRFPSHQLARLLLLDALDLDTLDDHVAAADGGHDLLAFHVRRGERALDRFGDDAGIHHLTFHDRVGEQRHDRDLDQLRLLLGVIDDRDLDESRPDVQADRGFLSTEQCHGRSARSGNERLARERESQRWTMRDEADGRPYTTAVLLPLPVPQARRATSQPCPQLQRRGRFHFRPTVGHRDRASGHRYR